MPTAGWTLTRRLWAGAAAVVVLILLGAPAMNRFEYGFITLGPDRHLEITDAD